MADAETISMARPDLPDDAVHAINQRIFETSLDLILVVDRHGTFIRVSPSSQAILGYQPDELVGRSATEILYHEDLDSTREEMRQARRGRLTRHFRCRYVHKDGRIVLLTWTGVWSEAEQQHFFIGRDITELMETARRLRETREAHDAAVSANQAKSRFLATASHDLRQPLHAMNLFISALRRRVAGEEAQSLVAGMASATESMQAMFNALLDVSKLEAGAVTPSIVDFELEQVLARLRASFAGPAAAKDLALGIAPGAVVVRSDPVLLESVLRNLLSNAVRYTLRGGVGLHCEACGETVRIAVSDTGPGIPIDQRERIFEEFLRLDVAGISERGLGLGLAIVRRLAELLGIGVQVASEVGVGSVFTLVVPCGVAVGGSAAVGVADAENPLVGRRLLLVEDDPLVRAALAREVADWGAVPMVAGSAEEALALLADAGRERPEIAIVDRDLGGSVNGPALLDLLRERLGVVMPAMIVTGATDPAALAALRESGYRWITKPVDPAVLRRVAGEMVGVGWV
jgi:two-component system, sensor histidine kinase